MRNDHSPCDQVNLVSAGRWVCGAHFLLSRRWMRKSSWQRGRLHHPRPRTPRRSAAFNRAVARPSRQIGGPKLKKTGREREWTNIYYISWRNNIKEWKGLCVCGAASEINLTARAVWIYFSIFVRADGGRVREYTRKIYMYFPRAHYIGFAAAAHN